MFGAVIIVHMLSAIRLGRVKGDRGTQLSKIAIFSTRRRVAQQALRHGERLRLIVSNTLGSVAVFTRVAFPLERNPCLTIADKIDRQSGQPIRWRVA